MTIIIKICSEENDSLYKKGNDPYNNYWNFSVNPTYVRQNWNNSMELVISIYTLNKPTLHRAMVWSELWNRYDATYVLIGDKAILHFNTGKALKIFKNYCLKLVIINHCRVLPTSRMGYFVSNIIESAVYRWSRRHGRDVRIYLFKERKNNQITLSDLS